MASNKTVVKLVTVVTAIAALGVGAVVVTQGANAETINAAPVAVLPAPVKGNLTVLASAPRITESATGPVVMSLNANQTKVITVRGKTFGDTDVPDNATGAQIAVTAYDPAAAGALKVWTANAGEPGSGAVQFAAHAPQVTNVSTVAFNGSGAIAVKSTVKTTFALALVAYVTPVPAAPSVKVIDATEKTLEHIGVSVKTECDCAGNGVTDLGKVTLEPGTYDVQALGSFSGIKSSADLDADTSIFGGLFVTGGAGVTAGFANVLSQNQGVMIPRSVNSATVTIDPTVSLLDTFKITETTEVHVSAYGYANDGVDHSVLGVKAQLKSARFTKVG